MTDREMLELAAKAAGYTLGQSSIDPNVLTLGGAVWAPRDDDGDAFRLAVKLQMNVFHAAKSAYALPSDDDGEHEEQVRYLETADNPYAATRLAILRAAAEIGKGL